MTRRTARRRVVRVTVPSDGFPGRAVTRVDLLATEEPLGIRVDGSALTVTMRTPGDDVELAAGFLVGEAVVRSRDDIAEIRLCDGTSCGHGGHDGMGNIADVRLALGVEVGSGARRNFMTTSACGVCGKTSIQDICVLSAASLESDKTQFSPSVLASLPDRLRQAQRVFARTGGRPLRHPARLRGGIHARAQRLVRHRRLQHTERPAGHQAPRSRDNPASARSVYRPQSLKGCPARMERGPLRSSLRLQL